MVRFEFWIWLHSHILEITYCVPPLGLQTWPSDLGLIVHPSNSACQHFFNFCISAFLNSASQHFFNFSILAFSKKASHHLSVRGLRFGIDAHVGDSCTLFEWNHYLGQVEVETLCNKTFNVAVTDTILSVFQHISTFVAINTVVK